MRWTYLLPRAILIGLVWAFFHYGFDPVLRRGMIYSGQRAARAKVEIAGLQTTFFAPTVKASNVQIADRKHPGTNLVEFADLHAKIEGLPLLKRSYIVEEASVAGLQWGTQRADSGLLPGEEPDLSEESDSKMLENIKHELLVRQGLAGGACGSCKARLRSESIRNRADRPRTRRSLAEGIRSVPGGSQSPQAADR